MSGGSGKGAVEVITTHTVSVQRFVLNSLLTNGFVVRDNDTGALAIVDPGDRLDDLVKAAEEWGGDVRWILVTHCHSDHSAGVSALVDRVGGQVAGPPGGPFAVDRPVAGGEALDLGARSILVSATPGHTADSVSYQIEEHVFVGDFLFRLGSGRTDGSDASAARLFETVREVFDDLPDETVLWCGHGPSSTVGEEKAGNPFWRVALSSAPPAPVDEVQYRGRTVPVLAWADDYDGGKKALLRLVDGSEVIVPGSQLAG
jgi:glyoxylase-like metal-dependent hydrolase (beta-lactamase superfamily II)